MARPRTQLQTLLESITDHVYFQPPPNFAMQYPCIVYNRDDAESAFANNEKYRFTKRYSVTVIDRNPDSPIPDQVNNLPFSEFNRFFVADKLNHDVFNVYF